MIKRNHWIWIIGLFAFFQTAAQQQRKPNIIVIVSDDGGYADFGCYGGTQIPTPHINALAAEGVRFTNAYVSASVCAPSRAGILTGRYQQRFGFEHNMSGKPSPGYTKADMGLDRNQKTMADELKASGYRTIAIGKWHQGNAEEYFPLNRGFDEFYGFREGHRNFFPYKTPREDVYALYDNNTIIPEGKITYLTDMFTQRAVDFISRNKARPFFMYLAYNAVHTPLQAKQKDLDRFRTIADRDRRTYAAMMASMDAGIGTVLQALKEKGIENNTLIFFINDNGGATNNASDNGILRGMKGSKWEGGIRVATIMKWPEKIRPGTVYNKPVISLDILPTALAAAHAKRTASDAPDGVNLLPYLHSTKTPHQALFWRRGVAAAVRSGKWKLIRVQSDPILLFDLETDISETRNLAGQHPEIVKDLLHKLERWEKGLQAPHWGSSFGGYNQIMKHKMETKGREMERKYP
ncbi:sulfatase [Niabella aurantiaca]|uniref:sulfatase n=1 Tax=Niabella aurantiaca TaxID=379900 RepID=UPI00037686BE|nr:sulfatase [Niabella aurantiaca]